MKPVPIAKVNMKSKGEARIDLQRLADLELIEKNYKENLQKEKEKFQEELKKERQIFKDTLSIVIDNNKAFMANELYLAVLQKNFLGVKFLTYEDAVVTFNKNYSHAGEPLIDLQTWVDGKLNYVDRKNGHVCQAERELAKLEEKIAYKKRELENTVLCLKDLKNKPWYKRLFS